MDDVSQAGGFSGDPLVSIIMPVHKVQRFLNTSVSAALHQTYRHVEVILIDDGSPDSCPAMCDAWVRRDTRVRVIHQPNRGVSAARNTGLRAARGDYFYFMDPDDTVELTLIDTCLRAMRQYAADLVMFRFDTINIAGDVVKSSYKHNEYSETTVLTPLETIKLQLQSQIDGYFWAFFAPAHLYRDQQLSFPEGRVIEDLARICNIIGASTRVVRIPDVLYHYRLRNGSVIGSFKPKHMGDWFQAVQERDDYVSRHYPELRSFAALQTLNLLTSVDFEPVRQGLWYGLGLDPESRAKIKRRIKDFVNALGDLTLPENTRQSVATWLRFEGDDIGDDGSDRSAQEHSVEKTSSRSRKV